MTDTMNYKDNIEKTPAVRLPYEAPALEVYEYKVEQGYAVTNLEMSNNEEITEITEGGSVFHGEWFLRYCIFI